MGGHRRGQQGGGEVAGRSEIRVMQGGEKPDGENCLSILGRSDPVLGLAVGYFSELCRKECVILYKGEGENCAEGLVQKGRRLSREDYISEGEVLLDFPLIGGLLSLIEGMIWMKGSIKTELPTS